MLARAYTYAGLTKNRRELPAAAFRKGSGATLGRSSAGASTAARVPEGSRRAPCLALSQRCLQPRAPPRGRGPAGRARGARRRTGDRERPRARSRRYRARRRRLRCGFQVQKMLLQRGRGRPAPLVLGKRKRFTSNVLRKPTNTGRDSQGRL